MLACARGRRRRRGIVDARALSYSSLSTRNPPPPPFSPSIHRRSCMCVRSARSGVACAAAERRYSSCFLAIFPPARRNYRGRSVCERGGQSPSPPPPPPGGSFYFCPRARATVARSTQLLFFTFPFFSFLAEKRGGGGAGSRFPSVAWLDIRNM